MTARQAGMRLFDAMADLVAATLFSAAAVIHWNAGERGWPIAFVAFAVWRLLVGRAAMGLAVEAIVAAIREPVRMSVEPMAGDLSPRGEALRRAIEDDSLTTTWGRRP